MNAAARYKEIAEILRGEIASGAWAVGDKLPAEPELIQRFDASRTTVRQALAELRDAGLVRMRHGVGVFVASPRVVKRLDSRERLSRARRERNEGAFLAEAQVQGFTPSSNVKIWFEPAQDFAELFDIDETAELCVRDRVMISDGQPVMLSVSRYPREITRGTAIEEADTGTGGVLARLEELGFGRFRHEEIVGAKMPDANEKQALGLGRGPVLTVQRHTHSNGRLVEVNDMVMPAESYELRYAWDAD
ncbi:GntR family transcriptional regulator [Saccharopolyspora sp. ASAGF58]|uniref:GntR family transcriptional regulator n=1 Tax=Saccharopolyspora sp. ASAGF58 TaxID=2719023 RepID=UPI00144021D2|nr:GntR family transcriptional regulator [Saccharopolyspora sp. ASAGF58]QIZ36375.1 GntR family transcriptional regulator [Saccharopolyspora sp. ASAGF58]